MALQISKKRRSDRTIGGDGMKLCCIIRRRDFPHLDASFCCGGEEE
jgi:hypothetical protein